MMLSVMAGDVLEHVSRLYLMDKERNGFQNVRTEGSDRGGREELEEEVQRS